MFSVLFLATAVSAVVVPRDVATVLANLEGIDASTVALTNTIVAWDASLLGALGIQSDVTTLESSITSATSELETETQADSADSQTILTYVSGTLGPDITAALNALVSRESDFDALGLNSLVISDLETLQSDTDDLGEALIALSSSDTTTEATTIVAEVDAAFASAIAAFS